MHRIGILLLRYKVYVLVIAQVDSHSKRIKDEWKGRLQSA